MAQAGMSCAQEMSMAPDGEQPNLCSAHCQPTQSGNQGGGREEDHQSQHLGAQRALSWGVSLASGSCGQ